MKESYFTSENINEKSKKMLHKLNNCRERHKFDFKPNASALLILDMQRYFLDKNSNAYIPSAAAILPNIIKIMNAFLKNNLTVILTRHIDAQNDNNLMIKWWQNSIKEKDFLSEIIPELNHPDAIVIRKEQYDAFYHTALLDILEENKISQLIITGVMTHLCCETTARSAFIRGFNVFFPIDGTATYNEDYHSATLLNLNHGFAIPALCEELYCTLEKS
jgi:isochorismate hydrolase